MSIVPVESERFKAMEDVADLKMQGETDTAIAKRLNLKRREVKELYTEYRIALSQDVAARDMARDHLFMMGEHYDKLIKEAYNTLGEIDMLDMTAQVAGQRLAAIKLVADLEAKRLDAYQKAGLLDAAELGDELAENERIQEIIIDILTNDLCMNCKNHIAPKLSKITGEVNALDESVIEVEVIE